MTLSGNLETLGDLTTPIDPDSIPNEDYKRFLLLGLDNSGKSTLIEFLSSKKYKPNLRKTYGLIVSRMAIGTEELPIMFLDVGGARVFQVSLWQSILDEQIKGVIYIIDSSDYERYDEQQVAFSLVLEDPDIEGIPILILASKLDQVDDTSTVTARLTLALKLIEAKIDYPDREISLIPISLKTGLNIDQVVEWVYRVATNQE
ncbi:MAG: ADP-ribosylation factor-like protein [Candidatus Hodarchaeales archaeon]